MAWRLATERCGPTGFSRPGNLKMWTSNSGYAGGIKKPKRQFTWSGSGTTMKLVVILIVAITSFGALLVISPALNQIQDLIAILPRRLGGTARNDNIGMNTSLPWDQPVAQLTYSTPGMSKSIVEGPIQQKEPNDIREAIYNALCKKFGALIPGSRFFPSDNSPRPYIEDVVAFPEGEDLILVRNPTGTSKISSCIYLYGQIVLRAVPRTAKLLADGRLAVTCSRPFSDVFATGNNQSIWDLRREDIALEMMGTGAKQGRAGQQLHVILPEPRNTSTEVPQWDSSIVYESQSTEDDVILYVKGLFNLKRRNREDYGLLQSLRCVFDFGTELVETAVTAGAMEVFRCGNPNRSEAVHIPKSKKSMVLGKPRVHLKNKRTRIPSVAYYEPGPIEASHPAQSIASAESLAKGAPENLAGGGVRGGNDQSNGNPTNPILEVREEKQHMICSCTMIWNMAKFLKEWIIFNSDLGVEKFFLYDNGSEDELESVVRSLQHLNVTVTTWPWVKTQEAGFSHCAVQAQSECSWILFADIDEFLFPQSWLELSDNHEGSVPELAPGTAAKLNDKPLRSLIEDALEITKRPELNVVPKRMTEFKGASLSHPNSSEVSQQLGQISFWCRNFGPSGLTSNPVGGVTQGYTCRNLKELRHKSLVHFPAITTSLRNVIHHFMLKPEFKTVLVDPKAAAVNHYKFQAWSEFKSKYGKRASTTVADWKEAKGLGSQDRPQGLGREALKPPDWETRYCEMNDTALRDYTRQRYGLRDGRAGSGDNFTTMVWQVADSTRRF